MKKFFVIYILTMYILCVNAQVLNTGYTVPFNPKFPEGTSLESIKSYFSSNASTLDPIEGLYDVTWKNYTTYSYTEPYQSETSYTIAIIKNGNIYYFYAPYNHTYIPNSWLVIEPLGTTGIYNFIFTEKTNSSSILIYSKERVALEHGVLFNYTHTLNQDELVSQDSRNYGITGQVRYISGIKIFPEANISSQSESWTGSGFALKDKFVATNYHVIDGASKISIKGIRGNFNVTYNAEVVGTDKTNDLALLKIIDTNFPGFGPIPYSISTSMSEVGADIFVLGYPLTSTMGDEIKLTTGIISSKSGYQGDVSLYQISAPIQPGNSGGPLFDNKGNIVGIVSAKHTGAENVGYAIKASYLRNLVESCSSFSILPASNSVSSLPLTGKVKAERNFVFYIICTK